MRNPYARLRSAWQNKFAYGHDTGFGRQRLPCEHGLDGFFYARLGKA